MLKVNDSKITSENIDSIIKVCPFNAIEKVGNTVQINAACKMCKICVKKTNGAIEFVEDEVKKVNKDEWKGLAVYCEVLCGKLHPVAKELLGEARNLADKTNQPVYALVIGSDLGAIVDDLKDAGADKIFVYDDEKLKDFLIERYTNVFEDFINKIKPSSILVASTNLGRVLAPKVAARFKTGLTADCTMLEIKENTDLVQIRPAFGGNIMARIVTPNARPQFCTVRYKIFSKLEEPYKLAEVVNMDLSKISMESNIECVKNEEKPAAFSISDADVIVAVGRGVDKGDLPAIQKLADLLGGQVACTRPLVESGWFDAKAQIGLSGRTVKPKLIFTFGISGAVQFTAGMQNSSLIVSVNTDEKAPIFNVAHIAVVGDYKEILKELISKIEEGK
ncbi:MAG: electron transfer flavoprotein subunit alpha [Clostridia bacterium]|nr:electron transfer flavoprotein subunit alpha [Clostridia bacterium]